MMQFMRLTVFVLVFSVCTGQPAFAADQTEKDRVRACIEKYEGQVFDYAKQRGVSKQDVRKIDGLLTVMLIGQCGTADENSLALTVKMSKKKIAEYAEGKRGKAKNMGDAMLEAMLPGLIQRMPVGQMFDEYDIVKKQDCQKKWELTAMLVEQKKLTVAEMKKAAPNLAQKIGSLCRAKKFAKAAPFFGEMKTLILDLEKQKKAQSGALDDQTLMAISMMKVGLPANFEDIDIVKTKDCEPKQRMLAVMSMEHRVDMEKLQGMLEGLSDKANSLCKAGKFAQAVPLFNKMKDILMKHSKKP